MRRGRIFFYLAFILILGLVGFFVVYQRFIQPASQTPAAEATPQPAVEVVNVVVVTQRIPRGSILDETVLGVVPTQKELFIQGMFTNVSEVVGRQAKFDLDAGIPLTNGMLVDSSEQLSTTGSTAALSIPRGMVAVSIPISRLSIVSYGPKSGDHVNVIVSMLFADLDTDFQAKLPNKTGMVIAPAPAGGGEEGQPTGQQLTATLIGGDTPAGRIEIVQGVGQPVYVIPSEDQRPRMASQTLIQDAVILQVGTFAMPGYPDPNAPQPTPDPNAAATEGTEAPPPPPLPDVITLIVSPQDAVTLNYLMYFIDIGAARLSLALRAAGDDTRIQTEAVTLQFLLDQYQIPVPVKLPYGPQPRLDILVPPVLKNDGQ